MTIPELLKYLDFIYDIIWSLYNDLDNPKQLRNDVE